MVGKDKSILYTSLFWVMLLLATAIFTGCAPNSPAPVMDGVQRGKSPSCRRSYKPAYYTVKRGDTLSAIAWCFDLNYKQLARWNAIKRPYTIYVGQKLRLSSRYKKPYQHYNSNSKKPTKPKYSKPKKVYRFANLHWHWPIRGKLIKTFNPSKGDKGIDIAIDRPGVAIRAAESGKVVYSGHGLSGYGLLLIIKHKNNFLTAYAHNSKLLVEEGSRVKKNQKIALSGKTETNRIKLHFEIRYNGKPVNPLNYLPK